MNTERTFVVDPVTKRRWKRDFRRRQQKIETIGQQTEASLDQHFFRRLGRLYDVRRFIISWVLLVVVLIGVAAVQTRALGSYYQELRPTSGGIYSEGMVGSFTNANPIFASTDIDTAVSRLLFNGLLKYDEKNHLVGDLASEYSVDTTGRIYTVKLRQNVKWHDGEKFTADDVLFTFGMIQNPDVRSPLFTSWQGIVLNKIDTYTVSFLLPNVFAPFPYSLTTGIVPQHILKKAGASGVRSSPFNTTQPVGTGPFRWSRVEVRGDTVKEHEQRIALAPNHDFYGGEPLLNEFIIRTFLDEDKMRDSFNIGELSAMAGVEMMSADDTPRDSTVYNLPLYGATTVFLRNTAETLKDANVRKALVQATDLKSLIATLHSPSLALDGPFLKNLTGYYTGPVQLPFDLAAANAQLDKAGWPMQPDGYRAKNGKRLTLTLNTLSKAEYASVASQLRQQWKVAGVQLQVSSLDDRDLQGAIDDRTYDVLLYSIALGADPDQFAYWHSTQADLRSPQRLNFSDYASVAANTALEAGRTRIDPKLRSAKYKPFLDGFRNDAPALMLYQPRYLYVTHGPVRVNIKKQLVVVSDRYSDVQTWTVRMMRGTN